MTNRRLFTVLNWAVVLYLVQSSGAEKLCRSYKFPEGVINKDCIALKEEFRIAAEDFVQCSMASAKPMCFCNDCHSQYDRVFHAHKNLTDSTTKAGGMRCGEFYLQSDSVQIFRRMYKYIKTIWDFSNCGRCFKGPSLPTDEVNTFYAKVKKTQECFDIYDPYYTGMNRTICVACYDVFTDLKKYYTKMKNNNHACADIVDHMNVTRAEWSRVFGCGKKTVTQWPTNLLFSAVVLFFSSFYGLTYYCGRREEDPSCASRRMSSLTDRGALPPQIVVDEDPTIDDGFLESNTSV